MKRLAYFARPTDMVGHDDEAGSDAQTVALFDATAVSWDAMASTFLPP